MDAAQRPTSGQELQQKKNGTEKNHFCGKNPHQLQHGSNVLIYRHSCTTAHIDPASLPVPFVRVKRFNKMIKSFWSFSLTGDSSSGSHSHSLHPGPQQSTIPASWKMCVCETGCFFSVVLSEFWNGDKNHAHKIMHNRERAQWSNFFNINLCLLQ